MFREVPKGTTKLHILLDTPARFSTQSIVIGRDAEEELVENAVIRAGPIALKCVLGLTLPIYFSSSGTTIKLNAARAHITVKKNRPSEASDSNPVVAATLATRQKTPKGRKFIIM